MPAISGAEHGKYRQVSLQGFYTLYSHWVLIQLHYNAGATGIDHDAGRNHIVVLFHKQAIPSYSSPDIYKYLPSNRHAQIVSCLTSSSLQEYVRAPFLLQGRARCPHL